MNYFKDIGFDQLPKYPVSIIFPATPGKLDTIDVINQESPIPLERNQNLTVEENPRSSGGIMMIVLIAIGILGVLFWATNKATLKATKNKD